MSWKYVGIQNKHNEYFFVHEQYSKDCYTVDPITPDGESLEELYNVLKTMTDDIEKQLKEQYEKTNDMDGMDRLQR